METTLVGREVSVIISPAHPTVIIGERINPTGKKRLAEALRAGDMEYVRGLAEKQKANGAAVLDVNVSAAGVDEPAMLPLAVETVASATGLPVCIDSTHELALPAALKVAGGTPLINSVTGEAESLARVIPLVKEYETAVIGLTMDDDGIPDTAEGRLRVAEKIVERAAQAGIGPERILIDCLALTVAADHHAALVTVEAIRLVREKLGLNLALGVSNVSHGLPERETINNHFLVVAIEAGVNAPIVDPGKARSAALIGDMFMGRDEYSQTYLGHYRATHPDE